MVTRADMLTALDALVKAGEVSPDYAAGVRSVFEKRALWPALALGLAGAGGLGYYLMDSPQENYRQEMDAYLKANPGAYGSDGKLKIDPDAATALVDRSRHWWDNAWGRSKTYLGNRTRKMLSYLDPTEVRTPEMFDRELADSRNLERRDYIQRELSRPGSRLDPEVAGAVQDAHVRDAKRRVEDAKRTMTETERENRGLTDEYADRFRTTSGTAAETGGLYQPKYDIPKKGPPQPDYGKGLPELYGKNREVFYRRPFENPLNP